MRKDRKLFELKFNVEEYLDCEFNIKTYEFLIKGIEASKLEIDPLDFFNLLYKDLHFFLDNKEKYLTIKEYFVKPDLEGWFKHFYFLSIIDLIAEVFTDEDLKNGVLSKSYCFLQDQHTLVFDAISPKYDPTFENQFWFDFIEVKKHLETLPDNIARKRYLLELKAENLQISVGEREWLPKNYRTFSEKCDIELEKIDRLIELEQIKPFKIDSSIKSLTAFEIALRHWYLFKARLEPYINAKQVGEKYGDIKNWKNIQAEYLNIEQKPPIRNAKSGELKNICKTLNEYPTIVKSIENDIGQLQ